MIRQVRFRTFVSALALTAAFAAAPAAAQDIDGPVDESAASTDTAATDEAARLP